MLHISEEFIHIIQIVAFLAIIWIFGRIFKTMKLSPLIGWILAGILFGPSGPPSLHLIHDNEHSTEVWKLFGIVGVTLMIAESGTHIHFDKIKKVGGSAIVIALIGTFLPLILSIILVVSFGGTVKAGFAVGCALAPTSVGVSLKLLVENGALNSIAGQTIVTAAFLDDVFSIILFVVLKSMDEETDSMHLMLDVAQTFLLSFLFLVFGILLAMYVFSHYIPYLLHAYIPLHEDVNYQPRDEWHLIVMMAILVLYSCIGDVIGSHLLGAFIAGVSFSQVRRSMYVWRRQIKRVSQWLIKLFFACSVAFTIPTDKLFSMSAVLKGMLFAVVCGVAAKVLAGVAAKPARNRWIVGCAMVGRGEFAYLVSSTAYNRGMIDDKLYAVIIWTLLLSVIAAPIAFAYVLRKSMAQNTDKSGVRMFRIKAEFQHHCGMHFEIVDQLHSLKLDIYEAKVETDGDTDCSEFIVGVSEHDTELDAEKINEILHDIRDAVGGQKAWVQLLPIDEQDIANNTRFQHWISTMNDGEPLAISTSDHGMGHDNESVSSIKDGVDPAEYGKYLLEIKLMSGHSPILFAEFIRAMEQNGIHLLRGHMEDFLDTDSQIIFGEIDPKLMPTLNIRDIKEKLKNVLLCNAVDGGILVKKVRASSAVFPHHVKFCDLLQSTNKKNHPLLCNKIQNGYEVDIQCRKYVKNLILPISNVFASLNFDIRTIDVQICKPPKTYQFAATFFVQQEYDHEEKLDILIKNDCDCESNVEQEMKKQNDRRHEIEAHIARIFQTENVAATIRTKAIRMGSRCTSTAQPDVHSVHINFSPSKSVAPANNNMAAILESVIVVTPNVKASANNTGSLMKGRTTFNLFQFNENENGQHNQAMKPAMLDFATLSPINISEDASTDEENDNQECHQQRILSNRQNYSNRSNNHENDMHSEQSASVIDILNRQSNLQ